MSRLLRIASTTMATIRKDADRLIPEPMVARRRLAHLALNPGFRALLMERVQEGAHAAGWAFAEQLVLNMNLTLTGAEFRPGCIIGPGAVIRHPNGIVIGSGVRIGENCTLQHGVTVGERYVDSRSDGRYPIIGSGVTMGSHCVVVGDVVVGDAAVIGALTFVNSDVPKGATAVGKNSSQPKSFAPPSGDPENSPSQDTRRP
jgi:serine O-acetyltransferase